MSANYLQPGILKITKYIPKIYSSMNLTPNRPLAMLTYVTHEVNFLIKIG